MQATTVGAPGAGAQTSPSHLLCRQRRKGHPVLFPSQPETPSFLHSRKGLRGTGSLQDGGSPPPRALGEGCPPTATNTQTCPVRPCCHGNAHVCAHQSSNSATSAPVHASQPGEALLPAEEGLREAALASGRAWQGAGRAPRGHGPCLARYRAREAPSPTLSITAPLAP